MPSAPLQVSCGTVFQNDALIDRSFTSLQVFRMSLIDQLAPLQVFPLQVLACPDCEGCGAFFL